ncbi:MAG TPA: LLM class flavin-dependent oxidoreductase [Burkholderiales bacterium]|nr:LLM class flavin-dependent oxidoreductase [Burkholderiales bacterium]
MGLRLSILDQSPIISGHSSADALRATVALAQRADELGFYRYWLAEHHNMRGLADPCPEILVGHVASATKNIRVGTGGVMLPYYSPLKVAEVFRMHEALHPNRIDLGIGRAPGGDRMTANAMNAQAFDDMNGFPRQVFEVVGWLDRTLPDDHPFATVQAMPAGISSPEVWLLGSSDYSGALAAYLGLRFAFAHFINAHGGVEVSRAYRRDFRPSARESSPYAMVCAFVLCAETQRDAERLAASIDHRRLLMAVGQESQIATVAEAQAYPYTDRDRAIIERERERAIIGTPDRVKARVEDLAAAYEADELMLITITGDYASRQRSYELLAAEFRLDPGTRMCA